jgi:hypothetical protein
VWVIIAVAAVGGALAFLYMRKKGQ